MKKILLLGVLALFIVPTLGNAQLIGVDFNNDASAANHDVNDPGNGISPTFTEKGLLGETFVGVNQDGKDIKIAEGITFDLTVSNGPICFRDQWNEASNDLFRDFVQCDQGETISVTIHGLTPKASYKLVVYGASTRSGTDATLISGAVNGVVIGKTSDGTRVSRNSLVKDQNYVQGSVKADDAGTITFKVSGVGGGWGILNGFGLAPDTEAKP